MRKLFIVSIASGYGGAERSIEIILRHLPADVCARIYVENPLHADQLLQAGALAASTQLIQTRACQTFWGRSLSALRLAFDIHREKPDAILVNTHSSALIVAMASRFVNNLGERCHLYVRDFLWRDFDYIFGRLSAASVIAPSQLVADRLGYLNPFHLQPVGPARFDVVPDMVELPSGSVSYDGPFLHLATINPWKGHADLITALHRLKVQDRAVRAQSLGAVGHHELFSQLQRLVDTLEMGDVYSLQDYTPDPAPLLRACRAVVIPSVSHSGGPETFGRATIEAWAYRKPVLAYETGAVAHLVENGVDGILVPEGDVHALAEALHRLNTSPDLCRRLGEAGHAKVMAHYEADAVTQSLLARLLPTTCFPKSNE